MTPTKQNLFLFFEENEVQFLIDRKLVKLYMNRCIIDEDANFEIIGVYELLKVTDPMFNILNPLYKTNASQRTNKESADRDIVAEAIEKASKLETNSTDNHFIIGSAFHLEKNSDRKSAGAVQKPSRLAKLIARLLIEVKFQAIRSLYVTVLAGFRNNLITKEMHKEIYDATKTSYKNGVMEIGRTKPDGPIDIPLQISVNDDFELSMKFIQRGRRLQQNMVLFLHPLLNPYELKMFKTKDETFLESLSGHRFSCADVSEKELKLFPDSDPNIRYLSCFAFRRSFYLKSS